MKLKYIVFLTSIFLIFLSCKRDNQKAFKVIKDRELRKIEHVDIEIKRYEKTIFGLDQSNLEQELLKIQNEYKIFLGNDYNEIRNIERMKAYLSDPSIKALFEEVVKKYNDLTFLEVQLTDIFRRIKVLFPDFVIPQVFTYVSGGDFENPIKYVENNLIIALDMYLGADFPIYSMWGLPRFVTQRMSKEFIAVACAKEIATAYAEKYELKNKSLLDHMIYHGKLLYFIDLTMPNIHDSIKIGYTSQQLNWAENNQGNVWSFFVDNDLLYKTERRSINNFIGEAPFTATFTKNSAPRIGHYIGWQIVRNCMKNNPDFSIKSLFEETNSTKILKMSGYKPRKR